MEKAQRKTQQQSRTLTKEPDNCHVVFHNDDVTTMQFVVDVLRAVFYKNKSEAETLMLAVHRNGKARVGTYPLDIALSKRNKAIQMARKEGYPLKITCEGD